MKTYVFANPKNDSDRVAVQSDNIMAAEKSIITLAAAAGFRLAAIHKVLLKDLKFGGETRYQEVPDCSPAGERWIDPAGGLHDEDDDDPALDYE